MPTPTEFAQLIRSQDPQWSSKFSDDKSLLASYLAAHPEDKDKIQDESQGGGFKTLPFAIRVIPAVAGGIIGSAVGPEGTAAGAYAGGAIGAGLGELGAQLEEYLSDKKAFRPGQVAAQTIVGGLPIGEAGSIASAIGKGAAVGAGSSAIEDIIGEGKLPDVKRALASAAGGAVLGGGAHAVLSPLTKAAETVNPEEVINEIKAKVPGLRVVKPTPGFDIPLDRPRTPDELQSFKSVKHMPEDVRDAFADLLAQSNEQRRGVQPIQRMEDRSQYRIVPLELAKPGATMGPEDIIAHRNAWTSIEDEINTIEPKIANGSATDAELAQYSQKLQQARVVGLNWVGATSEAARVLRVHQEMSQKLALMDSEKLSELMSRPKYKNDLMQLAKDRLEVKGDPQKELDLFIKGRKIGAADAAQAYLYNSILSGIKTPLRKTIADVSNMITNVAAHPFAVGADVARSALSGAPRTTYLGEMGPQAWGLLQAVPEALKEMTFVLAHGYSLKNVEAFAQEGVEALGGIRPELPGGYLTNFPLRNLKAVTAFFNELANGQELYGQAFAKAKSAGMKTPGQIQKFMVDLLSGDGVESKAIRAGAEKFAKRATFMDPSGPLLQAWLNVKESAPKPIQVLMTFLAPVVRLPGKIIQRGLETSPAGFMMKSARAGGREGAQAIGRATMGTLALLPFMMLAAQGKLSGVGPQDPKAREALLEKGWLPNAVKVGNTWVQYHLAQPFATEMAIAGSAFDRYMESPKGDADADSIWSQAERALLGGVRATLDQSYFSSLSTFLRAVNDPDRSASTFFRGLAQDIVPYSGLARNITQGVDPVVRKPGDVGEAIKTIIPGESQTVPSRLGVFGEDVQRPGGVLQRAVNPVGVSEEKADPVQELLNRVKTQLNLPKASLKQTDNRGVVHTIPATADQKHIIEEAIGREHRAVLEPLTRLGRVTPRMVEDALRTATRNVDDRAKALLRRGQPLTVEALAPRYRGSLNRQNIDQLYAIYSGSQK